jgi:hypothetical protein
LVQGEVDSSLIVLSNSGILAEWLFSQLDSGGRWLIETVTWIVLIAQAVYLAFIMRRHKLTDNYVLLPGAMYLLLMHLIPEFLPLSSLLLANTFLIVALDQLMKTYRSSSAARMIFDVGIWIGVACLFHFSYGIFIGLSIVGLGTMRVFKIGEVLTMWLGLACIAFLTFVYVFWNDQLLMFWSNQVSSNIRWLDFQIINQLSSYVALGLIAVVVGIVVLSYSAVVQRQNMQYQKKANVLYWTLLLGGLVILINVDNTLAQAAIISVPAGALLGLLLANISKTTAEVVHLLLLFAVLVWQWHPYWLK